jgi:hypothetical protein
MRALEKEVSELNKKLGLAESKTVRDHLLLLRQLVVVYGSYQVNNKCFVSCFPSFYCLNLLYCRFSLVMSCFSTRMLRAWPARPPRRSLWALVRTCIHSCISSHHITSHHIRQHPSGIHPSLHHPSSRFVLHCVAMALNMCTVYFLDYLSRKFRQLCLHSRLSSHDRVGGCCQRQVQGL